MLDAVVHAHPVHRHIAHLVRPLCGAFEVRIAEFLDAVDEREQRPDALEDVLERTVGDVQASASASPMNTRCSECITVRATVVRIGAVPGSRFASSGTRYCSVNAVTNSRSSSLGPGEVSR